MLTYYYLNEDHTFRPCKITEWSEQFEKINKHVADDVINGKKVSTVWLGLNHNFFHGIPLLFETMVFDENGRDIYMERYATWDEAESGHKKAIEFVINGCEE